MARDYYDESKPKKKKKETPKPQKVTKSPSVTKAINRTSNSTFLGGGADVKKAEKRTSAPTRVTKPSSTPARSNTPQRATDTGTRNQTSRTSRLTAAQTQKTYGTTRPILKTAEEMRKEREAKSKEREERRLAAQRQKSGLNDQPTAAQKAATDRALKNTLPIAKESAKGAAYGHLTTLNDIASIKSQGNGKSREEIYDPNLAEKSRQQAEQRVKKYQAKTQETEDAIQKLTKNAKGLEKAYYGAVESGTGMLTDIGIGALTGTGQIGSLASMFSRTYGSTRGKAQQEGATEAEDRAYAAAQAAKEVGTELMFPGAGLARGYAGKQGLKLADTAANILTKNLRGKAADIGGAGVRLLGGVLEENAEEVAGWGLDPLIKEITYGKNARTRNAQQAMKERSNALRAEIQNEDDARAAAAYLSSDDFFEQTVNAYREAGLSKKDAEEVADRMRDYLTASLTGDTDSMEQIEDEVSKRVAGSKKLEWDFDELKDTIASTTLLTAATGLPGTGMTAVKGAALRDQLGDDGVRALANTAIDFEDGEMSLKAKAMKARLDSGNELTSTQVYDLQVGMQEQIRKDTQREESSRRMADKRIKSDNLLTPYRQNENGGIDLDEATEASYREHVSRANEIIDGLTSETKESLTANEKVDGSKAIAGFQTGVFTIEDANTLNYSNTTVRAAFEEATGVDLGQYVVKNKDGSVNIPATNTRTKDALFAMAADNLVKSAQAETANWMDNAKGQVVTQVSARMGAQGSAVLQQALDDVDERDRSKYMMTANATDMLYQAARNMGTEWSDVASEATRMFPGISESKLKMMYEAGLADREMANDKARGRQVRMGQALTEMGEQETATGKVFIDTEVPVKGSVIRTFTEIAKNLGADIHFVDYIYDSENNPIAGANGSYDPNTNTFYLNVATGAETNIGYIFMHETTHYLKTYAPEQYQALENLVRERWFAFNPSQMQDAIARKIEAYKRATKGQQVLTEEQALEEIIADASHDFINDPEFARQVAEEDMGLAKAVLDSIRNALRMLRRIFASGSIDDDTHMNSLFRELDIMAEAEKLWLDAYKVAVQNNAINAVNAWQDEANAKSSYSLGYHAGDLGKSTVDDYAHQGYSRGTGHFGFGTYFVGDEEQINYGNYGKRKHEAVDFDKYNLFEPRNFDQALKLHDALRLIDGFITEYSDFNQYERFTPERSERKWDNTRRINNAAEELVSDYEWNEYTWDDSTLENKEKVDRYIADNLDDYDRNELERKARQKYEEEQSKSVDADEVRSELARHYNIYKDMKDFWGDPFVRESSEEEYVQKHLEDTIRIRTENKEIPYDYYYYAEAQNAIKDASEHWEWKDNKLGDLASDLQSALGYKFGEGRIIAALKETERIVSEYKHDPNFSRLDVEPGLDSGATVFMKQLGYEGVDVRHISEMDNTGYGSVIYDLKDEDLARKQEIGTARFSISDAPPMEELDGSNSIIETDSDTPVAQFDEDGSVRFSISSYEAEGRKIYKSYLDKLVKDGELSQQEADDMLRELETIYGISKKFADSGKYAPFTAWSDATVVKDSKGRPVFSAIKKNSEYKMNIDFSTICKKRRTLDAVFREMINRGLFEQLDLNKDESAALVVNINNLIRQHKFEAACALCFVEARRYRQQQTAKTFTDMWNGLVESMYEDKSKIAYFNFGEDSTVEDVADGIHTMSDGDLDLSHIKEVANAKKNGKPVQTAEAKAARLILNNPEQRKLMRVGDMMASTGFENMQVNNPELMKVYNSKKGTGGAKSSFGDVQYLNEIIRSKTFDRLKAYDVSGVRIQSFSDYVPRMVFDYVQVIADLAAKKLPAHAYTKEVLFARQFGLTGAKINLSLVPDVVADSETPGLDKDGNYVWNEEGTFPYEEAMELQKAEGYKDNCGTIAVGISDKQIIKMLADPTIQMVIPYHKSSLNPIVAAMTNVDRFTDYTDFQNTKDAEGKAVKKDFAWDRKLFRLTHDAKGNLLPKEKWGNVQDLVKEYAEWCKSKNYTPKFSKFLYMDDGSINPGYYKLLEDFALLDNDGNFKPQGDVQMRFPTADSAFGSMEDLIKQGLSEDTALEAKRSEEISGIVDEIEGMMQEGTLTEQSATSEKLAQRLSISDTDSDGNILTDGQMEFFKNSQARDSQGRLVPVYHTTKNGGFTIFDPMRSDDHRSLFFSDSLDVSLTYADSANQRVKYQEKEDIENAEEFPFIFDDVINPGYYACYLNLINPMIINGNGQEWDAISLDTKLPRDCHLELYTSEYLLDKAKYDDYLYSIGQSRKDGSKPREYGKQASKNGDIVLKFETGEWVSAKDDIDAIGKAINQHYRIEENDPTGRILADFFMQSIQKSGRKSYQKWLNESLMKELTSETHDTREWAAIAQANGHDGVIFRDIIDVGGEIYEEPSSDIYVAFSSNQVKDIDNQNPTANPDIRYSIPDDTEVKDYISATAESINDVPLTDNLLEENRVRYSVDHEDFIRSVIDKFNEGSLTFGLYLDEKSVKKNLIGLMSRVMNESGVNKKYRSETLQDTINSAKVMFYEMKANQLDNAAETAWRAAERIVDDIDYNDDLYVQYKGFRDYLSKRKIQIPEGLEYDSSFIDFVRDNNGRMRFSTKGSSVNAVYKYLSKNYPQLLPSDIEDPIDMLLQIDYALEYTAPYREAYTSEEYTKLVTDIAGRLMDVVAEGEAYRTVADKLTDEYEGRIKAMKIRHEEALRRVKETEAEKRESTRQVWANIAKRWKDKYNERVQKDKAERKEKADRREHIKHFGHIAENYNKLCTWVLNPTKEKNVPEEFRKSLADFLQALDLQTENSKKLEAKTGRVAQKTLKMRELKDRLNDLSARKGDDGTSIWEVDESIAFLLEKLSNKLDENGNTIDALDNDDIATIDEFMKLLIRNIERYKQVKTETKMAELSDIGGRAITFLREKIERDGMFKKKGAIQTINATALTPAYLFDRLGALKEMYDVLRHNGFDTYIRNEKMIMDRMGEILSGYYKTNKKGELLPGSEAEKWRDDRSAQTIELENGQSITMTAAQMMSLYCLTKRGMQAIGHMCVGGVVVTPIQTGSKIQAAKDRIKNRGTEESTEKRVLTINDIRNIISKLTEDQINVADKLQSLMSNEMAELGNEAHRELYGYEMFNEDNYFPIKVYGNERSTDINTIGDVIEKIKSFGFTKPLTPNANKALEIDDIFSVVADHCNGMNLYNAYLVPITDFMKVLNYTHTFEDGTVLTMKEAIEQAYGKDMLKYILNLMKDINGIKGENRGGLEGIMNKALGTAKRTAVFGNVRVALQQPTAIVRAAAEINPKYIKGAMHLDSAKGFIPTVETKTMQEMWKYCPIAQWKAWGYYDTYMGRDIEDVMMNKWSIGDKLLSGYYGQLDNATWSMIWQAVKAEQRDAHPDMDHNSEEFLQLCGRRASEVFDKTQVVDSTFHRSDAMRNKQIAVKLFTAFMAEPTLTMNVFRAGLFNANEASKAGNKGEAAKIRARAISVIVVQAVVVSAAQAFADAWRGKDPGLPWDDDDDEEKIGYWWRWIHNFVYNVFNQAHLENNMYLVKDVTPYINYMISQAADYWNLDPTIRAVMGWDQDYLYSQNNLVFAGLENTATGIQQLFKKLEKGDEYVDYKTKEPKKWYDIIQKIASGIGTFTGLPVGTLMRDFKPFIEKFLPAVYAADSGLMDSIADKMGYKPIDSNDEKTSKAKDKSADSESSAETTIDVDQEVYADKAKSIAEKTADLTGETRDKKVWSYVTTYLKSQNGDKPLNEFIQEGDYDTVDEYRKMYIAAGGNLDYFNERVFATSKSAMKKTVVYDPTPEQNTAQENIKMYLLTHGMSEAEMSQMAYESFTARDMKIAFRINDKDAMLETLAPLVRAGLSYDDLQRLWDNRNKIDIMKYKSDNGRYADRLKSTGKFIWPTNGSITSYFGYRNAPTRGASSNHPAIDIGAPMGAEVVASDGGVVISTGWNGGYGNSVGIKHDNGMVTYYNHLSAWNVKVGDTVAQGQPIANVGSTGVSTGPHLDFKVLDANGKPVDPLKYLASRS